MNAQVNAMRNHEELRDMLVEMKAYPKAAHRAAKYALRKKKVNFSVIEIKVKKK
jgi:hypothetical protein